MPFAFKIGEQQINETRTRLSLLIAAFILMNLHEHIYQVDVY